MNDTRRFGLGRAGHNTSIISIICMPSRDRWRKRYTSASDAYKQARAMFERTKATGDVVLISNAENSLAACKQEKDGLEIFKKDLGSFTRYYEFMSQIVDYEDKDLENLNLYGRHLRPLLRETEGDDDDDVDLSNVMLSHYRLSKIRHQDLKLQEDASEYGLEPGSDIGSAKARDRKDEFLSEILRRLNNKGRVNCP
ncbi:hypothetical protein [Marinobacterium sedimentorum]|uniref:hypothetical protein n=1 Tax=Marinobacterium sedimentorum TaxID=2927804 RepID=UPI0020C60C20|nr:hypothetical protein [Marinobacterium sedimentorum]MCP8689336.1 hypothetical protein [Marinobacterium sedimentorum]